MADSEPGREHTPVTGKHGRVTHYRVALPHAGIVETEAGHFEATEYAEQRAGWRGKLRDVEDRLVGESMSNARLEGERLSKKVALAIFSSDALSSTAYATQEIILILLIAGTSTLTFSLPIAMSIVALLGIVIVSYSQLIRAYPAGGGAYTVAHENLGMWPGLVAGASLLIDYTLTVAVSTAASVEAIVSAVPEVHTYQVPLALLLVGIIALGNLRGIRESGTIFAIPTYGFVFLLSGTIIVGLVRVFFGDNPNVLATGTPMEEVHTTGNVLTWFLLLRAFSAGCAALTGVEAISNGVSAFKTPQPTNAIKTMVAMGFLLGFLFLGTTLLARHFGVVYTEESKETVMSMVGEEALGGRNVFYFLLQGFTAGILFLAANTAYSGFPLLGAVLARDGYLPRLFHQRGNRLVFTYGIITLTGFSALLLVAFNATTTRLIPLYALGVFLCFTLAQVAMVKRWRLLRTQNWRRSAAINGLGAAVTAAVFLIILVTKFEEGGWMVVILIPLMSYWLYRIGRFYKRLERNLRVSAGQKMTFSPSGASTIPTIVPVESVNLATVMTLAAACERSQDVTVVHVAVDPDMPSTVENTWKDQFPNIPLVVINSPYRTLADPIVSYVNDRLDEEPHEVTLMIPLLEVGHWYHRPLVNQSLKRLTSLVRKRKVNVVYVPFNPGLGGKQKAVASGQGQ